MRRCLSLLVAATLLVVACTDTAGPSIERSRVEGAATAAGSGITLDQQNGATGGGEAQQAFMLKGFNPTNPHRGDAIVATFMWFGSTNVITAVTDHLANGTPVGNTYTLVEYVTAGGVSMATYVATNVQNFPDPYGVPGGAQDSILVVEATMSQAASDGAIQISAWSGVAATQAVGAHRSASGAAASQTVADPGAITVGAGAVAIGVTLSNGVAGVQTPAGWTQIGQGSDASMKNDGEYLVSASGGSVDPQWQWFFGAQSTWLATVFALNSATSSTNQPPTAAFTSSCSNLSCTFTNSSTDPDGTIANNSWTFGDGATSTAQNPSHSYGAGGTYTVTLTVTDNQGATNSVSHPVTVSAANQSPTAAFTSSCSNLSCTFTNSSSDPDGTIASNSWTFGDGGTSTVQNPSHSYGAGGTYTVTLTVTDNQGATNSVSHSVTVTAPNQPP
ncbi:MAG TPA: PKD domain-containing protein, partial [Gemmatimonadales bacterium]|nr:PKD domain-containing protein [Gemmatimonadales bacterium]